MGWLTTLLSGGDAVKVVGDTVENLFTNNDAREKALETLKAQTEYDYKIAFLDAGAMSGQVEINKIEASSPSLFVAGWRPAIGWVGAIALGYQFILYPLLTWLPLDKAPPAPLDYTMLYSLITAMLGVAGLRSFDKSRGTETKQIKSKIGEQ